MTGSDPSKVGLWRPEFGQVEAPWWDDAPAIVVGTGPSLRGFDHSRLSGLGHILAVKQAWMSLPDAEACVGIDLPWMVWARDDLGRLATRLQLYIGVPDQDLILDPIPGVIYLRRARTADRLLEDLSSLECAGTSGFAALNLAFHKKARDIYLFGFDFNGVHHAPEQYSARQRPADANSRYLSSWATAFRGAIPQLTERGIRVICASPTSTIDAFPRMTHEQAIEDLHRIRRARV